METHMTAFRAALLLALAVPTLAGATSGSQELLFDEEPVDLLAEEEEFDEVFSFVLADDSEEDEPEYGSHPTTGLPDVRHLDLDEEDDSFEFDGPVDPPAEPTASAAPLALDTTGKEPLTGNFSLSVVAVATNAVVVELPVYLASDREATEAGFLLVADVFAGDAKVTEVRQEVQAVSLTEGAPTYAFLKALVPVGTPTGTVKMVVKTTALDGTEPQELFTKSVEYVLAD
jgi:hypothetical protein